MPQYPNFTPRQAAHALERVLDLMKARRFFLFRPDTKSRETEADPEHSLDPSHFAPAIQLDADIRAGYRKAREVASKIIEDNETQLGLAAPDLSNGRTTVHTSRLSGALDICRVYPLVDFFDYAPPTIEHLKTDTTACLRTTWQELKMLKEMQDYACVVLLRTRFRPVGGEMQDDFLEGKLSGIQLYQHALGYLFWKYAKQWETPLHCPIVFNSSFKRHVGIEHLAELGHVLSFDKDGGYTCEVYIPIVL